MNRQIGSNFTDKGGPDLAERLILWLKRRFFFWRRTYSRCLCCFQKHIKGFHCFLAYHKTSKIKMKKPRQKVFSPQSKPSAMMASSKLFPHYLLHQRRPLILQSSEDWTGLWKWYSRTKTESSHSSVPLCCRHLRHAPLPPYWPMTPFS